MPGFSGTQLTAKLREFDKKTPILFYSAAAYRGDAEEASLAGAQGYLAKPVDNDDLIAEVARLIAESRSQ
jgi:CheY-like chemotaxis protein